TELRLATETLGEAQRRYRKGLSDYIPVLSSLSAKQRVELGVVSARADLLRNRVGLNQAVGGQLPLLNPEPGKSTE
ncbi:MAG: TolC family protein, partial [Victivallales bacterium]|nr:TolC family protein [Victivallales bacterium]